MKMFIAALAAVLLIMETHGLDISEMQAVTHLEGPQQVFFNPSNLTKVKAGTNHTVEWYTALPDAHHASYALTSPRVSNVIYFKDPCIFLTNDDNVTMNGTFNVSADFIGFNVINITIYDENNVTLGTGELIMSVILSYQKLNTIYTYLLMALVIIVYVNMGTTLDLEIVKKNARRPVGPAIALFCQFVIMPMYAYGLAKLFFPGNSLLQLGMFVNGATPAGGASNMWTLLLEGSLDLSIMMTFVSTIVAFGAIPLWVTNMSPYLGDNSKFHIPYGNIAEIVLSLVIPCAVGILIQKVAPKFAKFIEDRFLKPFAIFHLIFVFGFGAYSFRYMFSIFNWQIFIASLSMPLLGYANGFVCSFILRRSWPEIIAISIECGVQNTNIAIVILKFTLEPPSGELTLVIPACISAMTPLPLLALVIIKKTYTGFARSGGKDFVTPTDLMLTTQKTDKVENRLPKLLSMKINEEGPNKIAANGYTGKQSLEGIDNPTVDIKEEKIYALKVVNPKNK